MIDSSVTAFLQTPLHLLRPSNLQIRFEEDPSKDFLVVHLRDFPTSEIWGTLAPRLRVKNYERKDPWEYTELCRDKSGLYLMYQGPKKQSASHNKANMKKR